MHLSNETLERFAEDRLDEPELALAEEHLLVCPACLSRLRTLDEYVSSMRAALRRSEPNVILWQLHSTADGPIQIWVEKTVAGKWLSRRVGPDVDGGLEAESRSEALLDAFQSFSQLFPEHRCGEGCLIGTC